MKTLRAYILTRVLFTVPMLFILVTLVFFVVRIMPGDPVEAMLRPGVPEEYKDQIRHNLGLDRPLFINLNGSTARAKEAEAFIWTGPGAAGRKSMRVDRSLELVVSDRENAAGADWVQVSVPAGFVGWVSPDQMDWMRQVNTEMTVQEEAKLPGTETWARLAAPEGPAGQRVTAIWPHASGVTWYGSDAGVSRSSATGWDAFPEAAGRAITAIWSARPGDLWFGAEDGLLHLQGTAWTAVTAADGLPSNRVLSIWGQGSRTLWVGTDAGAGLYNGRTWKVYTKDHGLPGNQVTAIWGDGRGNFWFGADGGLARLQDESWERIELPGLGGAAVTALWGTADDGLLWAGTSSGLYGRDGQGWKRVKGLPGAAVRSVIIDEAGMVWAAVDSVVASFDGSAWTVAPQEAETLTVIQDAAGTMQVGTAAGLLQLDARPWLRLSVPQGGMNGWIPAAELDIAIKPFDSQYFNYLGDLLRLDLGVSMAPTRGRPVAEDLKLKFPATLELALSSLFVCMVIGVSTGAYAAHKRRSAADYSLRIFSIIIWAVPVFWLGIMLQLFLGVYLGEWYGTSAFAAHYVRPIFGDFLPLPISGRIGTEMAPKTVTGLYMVDSILTGNWAALRSTIRYMILPSFTLGLYLSGVFTRLTRSNMLDALKSDYVTAARARGISERVVVYRHALKNAFIPVLTMMGLQFAGLLAGAVLTETTFSWPGMGLFMWERIGYRDFNSIQGSVVLFAALVAAVSLVVEVIYAWIDPRIRY